MKNITLLLLTLFFTLIASAQDKKRTYTQFDIAIPLKGNPDQGKEDQYTRKKDSWFLPDGLSAKLGYGIHHNKWVTLGIHTGLDWKGSEKLVIAPIFANLKLSPKIADETRLNFQVGYGKSFAVGRGNLMGDYKKISLAIENSVGLSLFIEFAQYGFTLNTIDKLGSLSLGLSLTTF
jgi:hypothetical protein